MVRFLLVLFLALGGIAVPPAVAAAASGDQVITDQADDGVQLVEHAAATASAKAETPDPVAEAVGKAVEVAGHRVIDYYAGQTGWAGFFHLLWAQVTGIVMGMIWRGARRGEPSPANTRT